MTVAVPTRDELIEVGQSYSDARQAGLVVQRDSDHGIRLSLLAEMIYGLFVETRQIQDDRFVTDKVSTEALELHAEALFGSSPRRGATKASGTLAVKIFGTSGSVIPLGTELTSSDGIRYQVTSAGLSIPTVAPFERAVDVESIDTGTRANRDSGEKLTISSPPTGITAEADVILDITGGLDIESDAELIRRVRDSFRNPPRGGSFSDYRQVSDAIEGIDRTYTYGPHSATPLGRRGIGFVDLVITKIGSGTGRIPTAAQIQEVTDAIDDFRPATTRDFDVIAPTSIGFTVDISIGPDPGSEFDWVESTGNTVGAGGYVAATRTLNWTTAVDPNVSVGDRIYVNGQVAVVSTIGASTTVLEPIQSRAQQGLDVFDADLGGDPGVGQDIWPAGPLSEPVRDAIQAYADGLGPARVGPNGDAADPEQLDWDSTVRLSKLQCAAQAVDGVRSTTLNFPASDLTAADDGASLVEIRTVSRIDVQPE